MTTDDFELLRQATPAACERVLQAMGTLTEQSPAWQPQQAPGSGMKPAADARQVWLMTRGWTKMSVPSEYEDVEGDGYYTNTVDGWKRYPVPAGPGEIEITRGLVLPDQWPPQRHYHHAWYALSLEWSRRPRTTCWLRFDAVSQVGVVFVNGREAGRHVGGYTPFEFDISALLRDGVNTIAVRVQDDTGVKDFKQRRSVSQLDGGRGSIHGNMAGIRGGIYLERRALLHVDRVRVRTSVRDRHIKVETWLRGHAAAARISHAVFEWPAGDTPVLELPPCPAADGTDECVTVGAPWPDARWWSPAHPHLYVLRTTLVSEDGSETLETRFGFREFRIEGRDFLLNETPVRMLGDGSHPRELRSIVPDRSREFNRRWLEMLKREFNFTSTRLHGLLYPVWAVQAADEAGVLVVNQSGLRCGELEFYENGGGEFMRNLEAQYGEWYWRDANSPSVVVWDVENELIRGKRFPEREKWVLQLDEFIRRHDPQAIIEHSGAAWYHPDQQIVHVHMQEQYSRIMREWRATGRVPMVMGEFWVGGRGETRLPDSLEYADREDWHRDEARVYRERMLEMRYYGVSGIMPHRLTQWPLIKPGPLLSAADMQEDRDKHYKWRFPAVRAYGARGMAPVVGFVWPRGATVVAGQPFKREIVVCNDRETAASLRVTCRYAGADETWQVDLKPAAQWRMEKTFPPRLASGNAAESVADLRVEVADETGQIVESDQVPVHVLPPAAVRPPQLRRRIVAVGAVDPDSAQALSDLGLSYDVVPELPVDAAATIVLVPPDAPAAALGQNPDAVTRYLEAGGRLLVLPHSAPPAWLPLDLPFWTAVRSSVPEFDRGGWAPTNKDLIFTRDAPVYAPGHPAFENMLPVDFKDWSPLDGRISDDAYIRPNAVNIRVDGAWRVLLGATRRENCSLLECRLAAGTLVLCQAQVLRQREYPAARALLFNLLRYLDGPAWAADCPKVGLLGDLTPKRLAALTGLDAERFIVIADDAACPALILAGDQADPDMIERLARRGATVLVLSTATSARLPGFEAARDADGVYSGTRAGGVDHHLFWGVAGASFLPLEHTPVRGALNRWPDHARVVLGGHCRGHSPFKNDWTLDIGFFGLETREPAPPIAAAYRLDDGEVIATTIEPWDRHAETHRQLLCALLANAGVDIPRRSARAAVGVKFTPPLQFDGCLDDWTSDMEDFNVSVHAHAEPIMMTGRNSAGRPVSGDLDFSAVIYLLHDRRHLYLGGMVFSSGGPGKLSLELPDRRTVAIDPATQKLAVDGGCPAGARLAVGRQPAHAVIDTRLLNLVRINRQIGRPESFTDTPGTTFEAAVPWAALGVTEPPAELQARLRLEREDGVVLELPGRSGTAEYLQLRMLPDVSV